ncbi:MAG: anthranilate synthase component I family protein [Acidobacteria bacterium]|nr:anthranilate synthase component I family protein [Acidobacteriota bacterium]
MPTWPDVYISPHILPVTQDWEHLLDIITTGPGLAALLLSDPAHDLGQYSVAALDPYLEVTYTAPRLQVSGPNDLHLSMRTPFPLDILDALRRAHRPVLSSAPYSCGAVGFLAYDFGRCLEDIYTQAHAFRPRIPDLEFRFYRSWLVLDHDSGDVTAFVNGVGATPAAARRDRVAAAGRLSRRLDLAGMDQVVGSMPAPSPLHMEISREQYIRHIHRIHDYIRRGHVYQVNYSHPLRMEWNVPGPAILRRLLALQPVPFAAWLTTAGDQEIISLSPECFLRRRGKVVETYPIKGTRPRGDTPAADAALQQDLLTSPKDGAELAMIVDLERNDLGRVCAGGSVHVVEHRRLDTFRTLHHTRSLIRGVLQEQADLAAILRATFPGGSVTGVPKIRCMQIIHELEGEGRDIYTGSIGHLHLNGDFTLNIAIRTILKRGDQLRFRMGGGIVMDSDPEAEFAETFHKAKAFQLAVRQAAAARPAP